LIEWHEYALVEPFGPLQEEVRAAIPAALMANQWRKKGDPSISPDDLFPSLKPPKKSGAEWFESDEGQVQLAKFYTLASGGTILDGDKHSESGSHPASE
jgi:hypothetical protein